jgi:hypothetical protein
MCGERILETDSLDVAGEPEISPSDAKRVQAKSGVTEKDQNADDRRIQAKLRRELYGHHEPYNDPAESNEDWVREEYKVRRVRQYIVTSVGVFVALVASGLTLVFAGDDSAETVFLVLALPLVPFSLWNWRCPACGGQFWRAWNPRFCTKCGVQLQGDSDRTRKPASVEGVSAPSSKNRMALIVVGSVLAGCTIPVFLCCGGLNFMAYYDGEKVLEQLEAEPEFSDRVGQVKDIKRDLFGHDGQIDLYTVRGTKWSGRVTVKTDEQLPDDANILWARFTLPSGEIVEIKPVKKPAMPQANDD